MKLKNITEQKMIIYTAALLILAGVIRYFAYSIGSVIFYAAFAPFFFYRIFSIAKRRGNSSTPVDSYRVALLVFMGVTILFNVMGWQKADFLLLFLLMVDFLLVINGRF